MQHIWGTGIRISLRTFVHHNMRTELWTRLLTSTSCLRLQSPSSWPLSPSSSQDNPLGKSGDSPLNHAQTPMSPTCCPVLNGSFKGRPSAGSGQPWLCPTWSFWSYSRHSSSLAGYMAVLLLLSVLAMHTPGTSLALLWISSPGIQFLHLDPAAFWSQYHRLQAQ